MSGVSAWQTALVESWGQVWSSVLGVLPKILGAIVIFAIGLVLAHWIKRLVIELFRILKVEKLTKRFGIEAYLKKADIKSNFSELMALLIEWIIIFIFFIAAVDILGLSAVSTVLGNVLGYIPNVLAAALIVAVGFIIAGFAEGLVRGTLVSIDKDVAKPVGKLAKWLIILISVFAAIDQLRIAQGLINTFFQGLTYTIVLIVGLAVGLGSKDLVSRVLNDWYDKIKGE